MLTFFAVLSGLLWIILGLVGASKAKAASFFGSDSDLATVVALKAASSDSFLIMIMAIIGLCVAAAVREMLNSPGEEADKPGAATVTGVPATAPAFAPVEAESSVAHGVPAVAPPVEPVTADGPRTE